MTTLYACLYGADADPARLIAIAREWSPRLEVHGDRLVLLDVSGFERLLGDAGAIGVELQRAAGRGGAGRVQMAVAGARTAASLASRWLPGLTVVARGGEAAALAPLPIEALAALPAIVRPTPDLRSPIPDPRSPIPVFEILRRWGIRTLGAFAALPAAPLSERLGQAGLALQRAARGEDDRPLVRAAEEERFDAALDLEWPIDGLEPLSFVLARLFDDLCRRLARAGRGAVALRVALRLITREIHVRTLGLPAPMADPRVLRTLVLLDLESHPPPAGIDRVAVAIDPAPGRVTQYSLLERAQPSPEQITTLLARLEALMGGGRCGAPALVESHRPGAFVMRAYESGSGARGPGSDGPRPPDPLPPALRRFRAPIPARVLIERQRPVRATTDRPGLAGGRVEHAAGPWRTSSGWWTGAPWDRDEWDVSLSDGGVYRLTRDRAGDRWVVEGVFD